MADSDSLFLYHLTLRKPTYYIAVKVGSFLGKKKTQEIALSTPTTLELWDVDSESGKLLQLYSENAFSVIKSIEVLRPQGSVKDLLVVTSDSGKISMLEFDVQRNKFVPICQEPYSKNGFQRLSPGEYLCADPLGRAVFLSAIEKNKIAYHVQSNENGMSELSSPLTHSSKNTVTIFASALDTGYSDPICAAIECEYSPESITKGTTMELSLNYYHLDQGLNYIVKRSVIKHLPQSSNYLIPLPAYIGGVIICTATCLIYISPELKQQFLPLLLRDGQKECRIVTHFLHKLKKKNFFILLQNELGDCFKVTVDFDEEKEELNDIIISYFDTIPASRSIVVLRSGFLFADVLNNNKLFYQFEKLGEENENSLRSSSFPSIESCSEYDLKKRSVKITGLQNLALVDIIETLNPITDSKLVETKNTQFSDTSTQILTLSSHSYLRTITYGFTTSTLVSSTLPLSSTNIEVTKLFRELNEDSYLVLTSILSHQTLVLSIGDVVEEVADSGFVLDENTLKVQQIGRSSIVQVTPNRIRHIKHNESTEGAQNRTTDWYPPAGVQIIRASSNNLQIIIALSNREVCYFEVDSLDDQLIEYERRAKIGNGSILALGISSSDGRQVTNAKSSFAVLGCSDETIHVISLKNNSIFDVVTMQSLSSNASSIVLVQHGQSIHVHIGMHNGTYVRVLLDETSGQFSDTRIRFLGGQPVYLSYLNLTLKGGSSLLAISGRPWIIDDDKLTPILDMKISAGGAFYSEDIGGKVLVGISSNELIIFTIDGKEGVNSNSQSHYSISSVKLRFQPRKMVVGEQENIKGKTRRLIFINESESGIESPFEDYFISDTPSQNAQDVDMEYYDAFGFKRSPNEWASCVQVVDFIKQDVIHTSQFKKNEQLLSLCLVKFNDPKFRNNEYLVVGVAAGAGNPISHASFSLFTFSVDNSIESGEVLHYCHTTAVDYPPTSLTCYQGKLIVGMKNYLRTYEMGHKQLLRKSSTHINFLHSIMHLSYQGHDRVFVADSKSSVCCLRFDNNLNKFVPIVNDFVNRQVTALGSLDFDTFVGGDKFGNIYLGRMEKAFSEQAENYWPLVKAKEPFLNGSASRFSKLCDFYIQDVPTSFSRGSLLIGGKDSIIYTGLQGTVGIFIPLSTKQEIDFLRKFQELLRSYFNYNFDDFNPQKNGYNLFGKDHLKFRSYYNPSKNVIDGDFLERYFDIEPSMQVSIARDLGRTPKEIERRIHAIRNRSAN